MRNRIRAASVLTAVFVPIGVLAVSSAPASAAATVTIGQPSLVNKVLVNVSVSVVCDIGPGANLNGQVTVTQASGKQLHSATIGFGGSSVNCDGVTPQVFHVQVVGGPFTHGKAVISAGGSAAIYTYPYTSEPFSSGVIATKL